MVALIGLPKGYSVIIIHVTMVPLIILESAGIGEEEVEIEVEEEGDQYEEPGNQLVEQHHPEFTLPHQVSSNHLV